MNDRLQPHDSSSSPTPSRSVTVVSWQALPAILPERGQNVGGLETAAWRVSRSLARLADVRAQIIVRSPGRSETKYIDDVEVSLRGERREYIRRDVSACLDSDSRWILRRFSPHLLWQVPYLAITWLFRTKDPRPMEPDPRLQSYRPDAWITLGASRESAGVVATAITQNKPVLLYLQSNADLDPRYASDPERRNAYGEIGAHCHFAIRNASDIACQTLEQQAMLKEHFGRDGFLLPNAIDPAPWISSSSEPGEYVLWIGRFDTFHKRPQLAMAVARLCPEIPFRLIINRSDPGVRQEIMADVPANVQIVEYVPRDAMPQQFGHARIFFSTGNPAYEGFPTVLLEAVAARKPIVSMQDFDEFISRSRAGRVCNDDIQTAADAIRHYWQHPADYRWEQAMQYLTSNHSESAIADRLAQWLSAPDESAASATFDPSHARDSVS